MREHRHLSATPARSATYRQMARVARGGAMALLGAVVSAISGFVLVVVVTRLFSPHLAGVLFAATSAFLVLLALVSLGTDAALSRFSLMYETQDRWDDQRHCLRTSYTSVLVCAIGVAVAVLVLSGSMTHLIGLDDKNGAAILRVLALALPAAAIMQVSLAATRAYGRMRTTTYVDKFLRSGAQPVLAAVVGVAGGGILALTAAWVAPYVAGCIVGVLAAHHYLRRRRDVRKCGRPDHSQGSQAVRREFWRFAWPRALAQVSQMFIQRGDIVIIAVLRSPSEAAIYTAATRFVTLGQFGTRAIQQVLQPRFTHLLSRDDLGTLGSVYKFSTAWSMAVAWPLYLIVGCAPFMYLSIFGSGYRDSAGKVVVVMMIAMLLAVLSGSVDSLLLMSGRSSQSLMNSVVALTVDVGLCFALIPVWGILGAAVAWGVAVTSRCGLAYLQVRGALRVTPFGTPALIVGIGGLAAFGVPLACLSILGERSVVSYAAVVGAGLMGYLGILWWARKRLMLGALREIVR